jgi:membrane fusion protein (multidrug efflux system)
MADTNKEQEVVISTEKKGGVKRLMPFIFGAVILAAAFYGWHIIQYNKVHENTDDAQIDADISPIIPRVSGYVMYVKVSDNDKVDSGALLVQLDTADLSIKVKAAQAAIESAQAAVASARSSAAAAQQSIATAEVAQAKSQQDLNRARGLLGGNAITQQQFDDAKLASETAADLLKTATAQAAASETQINVALSQVKQKMTDLDNARLQLSYATIKAPVAGTVAKKNVEVGEFIQAGQPLMAITPADMWITANMKETQTEDLHVGQKVDFKVDAYPDSVFHGTVQSLSPATGAKFSLLPPDNASGNFVKVTQRVPVKILIDRRDYSNSPLRPGMSVDVTVTTGKW